MIQKIRILENSIQEYAWGSKTFIANLLGLQSPSTNPQAELWMGAHPKAPSNAIYGDDQISLDKLIEKDPVRILGQETVKKFPHGLPFLLKVLAAEKPLSIQAHPNKEQAEEGFTSENKEGIPIDAPNRNYRDNNHKPEIICALTPFVALNGFRNPKEALKLIEKVADMSVSYELAGYKQEVDMRGLRNFLHALMNLNEDRKRQIVADSIRLAEKHISENLAYEWMIRLNQEFPGDIGIFAPCFLNLVELNPYDAMYLDAQDLHAYLSGAGIELMANSDNVLRGGLTSKHVDITELFKIVKFVEKKIELLKPIRMTDELSVYETPAQEFQLSMIELKDDRIHYSIRNRSIEIMICVEGESMIVDSNGDHTHLENGISVIIPASVEQYQIKGNARIFKASVPIDNKMSSTE